MDNLPTTRKKAKALGSTHYFTGKVCKNGHVDKRLTSNGCCFSCIATIRAKHRATDTYRATTKRYLSNDDVKQRNREAQKRFAAKHKEETGVPLSTAHRRANPEWWNNYKKRRRANDPQFHLALNLRNRVWYVIKGCRKSAATLELIGCSPEQLIQHLEAQFTDGMTWDNYGSWHVDHIRPCASFDLENPEQQRQCFNYKNLQPLWAEENIRKADRWEPKAA